MCHILLYFVLLVWSTGTPKKERHDWFVTWFILWSMKHMFHGSCYARVTSHTCVSHVTDSYAWHDSFEWYVSCVSLWVMSRTYVRHVTWRIRTRDMTPLDDSVVVMSHVTHERESRYTYARVMSHLFINHVTRMNKDECVTSFFFCSLVWSAAVQKKDRHDWFITWLILAIYGTHV